MLNKQVKLQVFDTAGQERFRTLTANYYKAAMGVLLLYDVTDEKSFENTSNWVRQIDIHASENIKKFLIANKVDLEEKRVISTEQGEQMAI